MSRHQATLSGFPARTDGQDDLALHVAFTSERATAEALRYAAAMANGLRARLQVIVPQVVPYGRDLNDPDVNPKFTVQRALQSAREAGIDADVHVVLCRDRAEGLHNALGADGLVLIGGRRRWWPFAERTLAKRLSGWGHKVLFVEGSDSL